MVSVLLLVMVAQLGPVTVTVFVLVRAGTPRGYMREEQKE